MKKYIVIALVLTFAALGFRLSLALRYPNGEPDDGRVYAQIARNVLNHESYSADAEEPHPPTLIRVPGYPLFIAGVYKLFGQDNNRAVRAIQALIDTATCWVIALLAFAWSPAEWSREKRRHAILIALALASTCPFVAIYVTTILTEICATFFLALLALAATLALKSENCPRSAALWMASGLFGGIATMFRSDSGIFVAAAGVTLVVVGLQRASKAWRSSRSDEFKHESPSRVVVKTITHLAMLSLGMACILAPWTIRNARLFGLFQPLAPIYAKMPGAFVPHGYYRWLRTWVGHSRYVETFEFNLDTRPIRIENAPPSAFDSPAERARVAELFDRYNNKPALPRLATSDSSYAEGASAEPGDESKGENGGEEKSVGKPDSSRRTNSSDARPDDEVKANVEMTREIDAEFGEIARDRIACHPGRYYVVLPLKRVLTVWFDNHSQYYPFQGNLLPFSRLDRETHQQYWLPLFAGLVWTYTALALIGCWVMWRGEASRRWVLLLALLILPRLALLSTLENPEPRYVVQYFALVVAVGALAIATISLRQIRNALRV
jgi:hypothetical protein